MLVAIPIQIFLKSHTESIWTTINTVQLISHEKNLQVHIPAQVQLNLAKLLKVSNLEIHEIQAFQEWMRKYTMPIVNMFTHPGVFIVFLIFTVIVILVILFAGLVIKKYEKDETLINKIKSKIMWSSLLRWVI